LWLWAVEESEGSIHSSSHVINALARSGVGKLRVIDFDTVSLSSINRHAFALRKDVGKTKVQVLDYYLKSINPGIDLDIRQTFLKKENVATLLQGSPDMVIDCIDDVTTKCDLIQYCVEHKLQVISSGGAGMKADPTRIQLRDISETNCKLKIKQTMPSARQLGLS
jgi:tRNA threonylcarbamoyladenosine dehydratase